MANHLKCQTNFIWGKQFGSDKDEYALNHLIDNNGNVYIAGKTNGIMNGKNYGKYDGFITKIDSLGNTIWTRQFGSDGEEDIQWSAIDNTGCVYITGSTTGVLNGKNFARRTFLLLNIILREKWNGRSSLGLTVPILPKGYMQIIKVIFIIWDLLGQIYLVL
jgi:hypothetical protein